MTGATSRPLTGHLYGWSLTYYSALGWCKACQRWGDRVDCRFCGDGLIAWTPFTPAAAALELADRHSVSWHRSRFALGGPETCECGWQPSYVAAYRAKRAAAA